MLGRAEGLRGVGRCRGGVPRGRHCRDDTFAAARAVGLGLFPVSTALPDSAVPEPLGH
jgi:hypothetical protein